MTPEGHPTSIAGGRNHAGCDHCGMRGRGAMAFCPVLAEWMSQAPDQVRQDVPGMANGL